MPELPDLLYIVSRLRERLLGRHVTAERVREPVVLRFAVRGNLSLLLGRPLDDVFRKSHFLVFRFEGLDLAVNPMLAGRFRLSAPGDPDEGALALRPRLRRRRAALPRRQEDGQGLPDRDGGLAGRAGHADRAASTSCPPSSRASAS